VLDIRGDAAISDLSEIRHCDRDDEAVVGFPTSTVLLNRNCPPNTGRVVAAGSPGCADSPLIDP